MSLPASPIAATLAQTLVELRLTSRRGENMLVTAIVPVVVLVFFASIEVFPTASGPAVDFLLPGTLALAVVATSLVSLGISTAYERSHGVLKRLGGSPLTRGNLVAAKIGAVLLIAILQAAALVAVAWSALGWTPAASASSILLLVTIVLGTVAFAGLGLLLAGVLRAEATLALANALFLATLLLGGVIVPVDELPDILATVAGMLPASALSEAFRIALGADGDASRPLLLLAAWGAVAFFGATRTFRWD